MAQAKSMRGAEDPTDEELAAERLESLREEARKEVLVEFIGTPPYGREFITAHTIEKSPATGKNEHLSFAGMGVDVPKTLVWSGLNNYMIGIEPGPLLEALRTQPYLKIHD